MTSTRDVIIRPADFAKAVAFYEKTVGSPVTLRQDGLVGFETGEFQLFVEKGKPAHGPVFEMLVSDVQATKKKLLAEGCTLVEEDPKLPRCYLKDPTGLVFNVGTR